MKKSYVKSMKGYEKEVSLDAESILAGLKRFKNSPKQPTSIALDETTKQELKQVADKQGIPYQVLMRIFILEGLNRMKKAI